MPTILGINAFHAGASAALVIDGKPVAAIAEERLNRIKYYGKFPTLAIAKCMDMAGITLKEVDYVAVSTDITANLGRKLGYALRNVRKTHNLLALAKKRKNRLGMKAIVAQAFGMDPSKLRFRQINVEHHLAHTASAFFVSPWEHCAGFTMDGSGDFVTCMLSECRGDEIQPQKKIYVPHSIGTFYTMICDFIGYRKYGDEGKVMGLAPYGEDSFGDHFQDMLCLTPDGFKLNIKYFMPLGSDQGISFDGDGKMVVSRQYSDYVVECFGEPRERYSEITKRDMDLAYGVQSYFEKAYMHMLNLLYRTVPCDRVAMAGGSVLNSVANGRLFDFTPFQETVIQPAAGDEGNALGAALYVSRSVLREKECYVMANSYLGPEYSAAQIKQSLDKHHCSHIELDTGATLETAADDIADGKVVGWFQGRMEWGPRALGNRSILANPALSNMKDILNSRIKRREWFRPFAPSVLADRQTEIFEHTHPSPFMLHVYKIKPAWRKRLTAVNHVDNTGRLQTVRREENPLYYDLIKKFDEKTGIPVVLNTSFNENEPIVCTPDDAIDCFLRTKMDVLFIGPYMCRKPENA